MKTERKTLRDIRWIPLEGDWSGDETELLFKGYEYDPPTPATTQPTADSANKVEPRVKFVSSGNVIFGEPFSEGRIGVEVTFDHVDHRSQAGIIIQYDTETKNMLTFTISGGGLPLSPTVTGYLFKLQSWAPKADSVSQQGGVTSQPKVWTALFEAGSGRNLKASQSYNLEVAVRGASITLYANGVEIGKRDLDLPSLRGFPCGLFCMGHSEIKFQHAYVETQAPKAFVVMQFDSPEYDALFKEVIDPVCRSQGLAPYRADFTYLPGLIIEDIKKQIQESRVVIAEITPHNPNVYYEVGYADALNKPIILISDRKEGMRPFDVRAYRTIFYENSISGKDKIMNDLRAYLTSIMEV